MASKSRVLNKNPLVLAQPQMGKRDKPIYDEVCAYVFTGISLLRDGNFVNVNIFYK